MERPNYYGILPAAVRYAKIADRAKVLYTEITALANQWGYCTASNGYFSRLYECTPQAISKHIQALEDASFISSVLIYDRKEVKERRIYPTAMLAKAEEIAGGYQPTVDRGINPQLRGYQPTVEDNNTSNNINILSNSENGNFENSIVFQSEDKFDKALAKLKSFLEQFPDAMQLVCTNAHIKPGDINAEMEMEKWLRNNQNNVMIMQSPEKFFMGGKNSFYGWLTSPFLHKKDKPTRPAPNTPQQPTSYTPPAKAPAAEVGNNRDLL